MRLSDRLNLACYHKQLARTDFVIGLVLLWCVLPLAALLWRAIDFLCN